MVLIIDRLGSFSTISSYFCSIQCPNSGNKRSAGTRKDLVDPSECSGTSCKELARADAMFQDPLAWISCTSLDSFTATSSATDTWAAASSVVDTLAAASSVVDTLAAACQATSSLVTGSHPSSLATASSLVAAFPFPCPFLAN